MSSNDASKPKVLTGRHVLWTLLGAFAVVAAVNGVFIYQAIATYSGDVAVEPYRKGLHYNKRIEADERQAKLGWSGDIALKGVEGPFVFTLKKPTGEPISGLVVTAELGRGATRHDDMKLTAHETAPGIYQADVHAAPGIWIAAVSASETGGTAPVYRARKRLCLGGELAMRDGLFVCQNK